MTGYDEFPIRITKTWILKQQFPYNCLVNYIIHVTCEKGLDDYDLSPALFRLWLLRRLETDVDNGGFEQFFGNALSFGKGTDKILRATLPGVRAFGLSELAPFVSEVIKIYEDCVAFDVKHKELLEKYETQNGACRIGPTNPKIVRFQHSISSRFDRLDKKWNALDYEAWQIKLEKYIRQHPEECDSPALSDSAAAMVYAACAGA